MNLIWWTAYIVTALAIPFIAAEAAGYSGWSLLADMFGMLAHAAGIGVRLRA